jgi:hypothetical protein
VFDKQETLNREQRLEKHIETVVTVGLELEEENQALESKN